MNINNFNIENEDKANFSSHNFWALERDYEGLFGISAEYQFHKFTSSDAQINNKIAKSGMFEHTEQSDVIQLDEAVFEPAKWVSDYLNEQAFELEHISEQPECNFKDTERIIFHFDDASAPSESDEHNIMNDENANIEIDSLRQEKTSDGKQALDQISTTKVDESCDVIDLNSKSKGDLSKRKDVLNKGSIRVLRKAFKHLFQTMYKPKRKRTEEARVIQLDISLNRFVSFILGRTEIPSDHHIEDSDYLVKRELVGRIISPDLFNKLPISYSSYKSKKIKKFVKSFNK